MLKKTLQFRYLFWLGLFLACSGCTGLGTGSSTTSGAGSNATDDTTATDSGLTETPFDIPITIAKVTVVNTVDAQKVEGGGDLIEGMVLGATSFGNPFIHCEEGAADADANIAVADVADTSITLSATAESDGSCLIDLSSFDLSVEGVHTFSIQETNGLTGDDEKASDPIYLSFDPNDSILDSSLRFSPFNVTVTYTNAEIDGENSFSFDNTGNVAFNITVDDVARPATVPARGGSPTLIPNITTNVVRPHYASDGSFFLYTDSPMEGFRLHQYDVATETDTVLDDQDVTKRFISLCDDDEKVIQEDAGDITVSLIARDLDTGSQNLLFIKNAKPVDIACLPNSTQGVAFLKQGANSSAYLFSLEESHVVTPTQLFKTTNAISNITPLPDSSGFVYISTDSGIKQLHRFTLSNSSDTVLTSASSNSVSPSVNFDGSFVLFQRMVDDLFQIHAYEFETGNAYQLTSEVQSILPVASKSDNTFTYKYGDDFQVGIGNLDNLF